MGCFGDLPGDEIVVSPPSLSAEPLSCNICTRSCGSCNPEVEIRLGERIQQNERCMGGGTTRQRSTGGRSEEGGGTVAGRQFGATPTVTEEKAGKPTSADNHVDTPDEKYLVEIFIPMPENWLRRQSLVYVIFGKISKAPTVDLDLATNGPVNRKRKIDVGLDAD